MAPAYPGTMFRNGLQTFFAHPDTQIEVSNIVTLDLFNSYYNTYILEYRFYYGVCTIIMANFNFNKILTCPRGFGE